MTPTNEQREYNEYLLEHFRRYGLFKCVDCIYCKEEQHEPFVFYKCLHNGTAVHQATKDRSAVMMGSACFWFEPRASAGANAGARKIETERLLSELWDYAITHTKRTPMEDSADEQRLGRIRQELFKIGVRP